MSQHDMTIAGGAGVGGATVRTDIEAGLQALASTSKGPGAPSTLYQGQFWIEDDNPSSTVWTLWVRGASGWSSFCTIDTTTNEITLTGKLASAQFDALFGSTKGLFPLRDGSAWGAALQIVAACSFDGTGTPAIRGSQNFNVSSITDLGTGLWRVNIDTDAADANYMVFAFVRQDTSAGDTSGAIVQQRDVARNAGYVEIKAIANLSGTNLDCDTIDVLILKKV